MVRDILINTGMPSLIGALLQSQKSQTAVFLCLSYMIIGYMCLLFSHGMVFISSLPILILGQNAESN